MKYLSEDPSLSELRTEAKELRRDARAGELSAIGRVLASHPNYAGRPADRLHAAELSLRDTQATIAREHGLESWAALVAALEERTSGPTRRWSGRADADITTRAFAEAKRLRHHYCSIRHVLLAVLNPPEPTPASRVLADLGVEYEAVEARFRSWDAPGEDESVRSTLAFQAVVSWARGFAVATGTEAVADEHVLLALAYGVIGWRDEPPVLRIDVDPDEVVDGLRNHGVDVPSMLPPLPPPPRGPFGPSVYYPADEQKAVMEVLVARYPPGSSMWGWNVSSAKPGCHKVDGEDDIPLADIVRSVVTDPSRVEVVPFREAIEREAAAKQANKVES